MQRDTFLSRVRRAAARTSLPQPPGAVDLPRWDIADRVAAFSESLRAVDGQVHAPGSATEARSIVVEIFRNAGIRKLLSWDQQHLPLSGVLEALASSGIERLSHDVPQAPGARHAHQTEYDGVQGGLTGAGAGFAVSGSVVLTAGPGRPRMASLIPEVHVALLPVDRLHDSVSTWAADHPDAARDTANLVFVTGPSRTGDIEMQLNLGVHGPRSMHVVLLDGD